MKPDGILARKIADKSFVVTAELLPGPRTDLSSFEDFARDFNKAVTAINVADNHYAVGLSSLAGSVALSRFGLEPVYQIVTRDRNRIAIQSDLLAAAMLGIKNVLCLSGYHQTLIGYPESANVFDIDSIQLITLVKKMNEGFLLDGTRIEGPFSMLIGAVANPFLKPLELNIIRLQKKVDAGANFIQTQAVFDVEAFEKWFEAVHQAGLTEKAAILAGVLPLKNADEARKLVDKYTDLNIPVETINRIERAGGEDAQRKESLVICRDIVRKLKGVSGLAGIHLLSGDKGIALSELIAVAAL